MPPPQKPLNFERLSQVTQLKSSRKFLKQIATRRTVRDFSPEPVAWELIENAVRAASTAPSGANQQPWQFVVVSDPALKREIRIAAETEEKESYEHRMPKEWLEVLLPLGTDWRKPFLEIAPYLIVVFRIDYGISPTDGAHFKHYYVHESVGIACGVLLAALHLSGLATLTHTPSPMGFLSKILARPANERPFLLIPVGYPAPNATVPDIQRKSLDQVMVKR